METIESLDEAVLNAAEFNRLSVGTNSEALRRFSQFFHWYYFPNLDTFAPSKFIGYKNTTIDNYLGKGHGGETQRVLSNWFRKVEPGTREYNQLREKLELCARRLGKAIGRRTFEGSGGIYVLNDDFQFAPSDTVAEDFQAITRQRIAWTTKKALINARIGQGAFRMQVLNMWGISCAVTGSKTTDAIRASHIKPWRDSSNEERLDPNNGIPLVANLDALFDARLIAFSGAGDLLVSAKLSPKEQSIFSLADKKLQPHPTKATNNFLAYHRQHVFRE
ncbi:MAG: HNH endonuclease [Pirellulales bacterium]